METTAQKVKKYREAINYSQQFVANELGISQPAYVKIEKGITRINLKRLLKLSAILKVEPSKLLEGSNTVINQPSCNACNIVEDLYNNNKEIYQTLITQLQKENLRLTKENELLLKITQQIKKSI